MSQFKLVSVHSLGRGVLWHSLWAGHRHALADTCVEDYFVQLFRHFMRAPCELAGARPCSTGGLYLVRRGGAPALSESLLLSCHLLYYQD